MRGDDETGGNKPLKKAEQDRDDLNNEMAGREVGRAKRFLPGDANPASVRRRREQQREFQSGLMALLQSDPEYAALYNDTMDKLRRAEQATEAALVEAKDALSQAKDYYEEGLGNASTLPDGTRVFRDGDGNVRTEDGRLIEGDELDQITWRDGAPSYEDILARRQAIERAEQAIEAIRRYQVDVLGTVRDRLTNEDDPPTMEELEEIQKRIEKLRPEAGRAENEPEKAPDVAGSDTTVATSLPKM